MKTYTTKIAKNGATLYYSTETGKRIAKETALENERNYILTNGTVKERYELAKESFRFNERGEVERLWFHDVVSYGNRYNFKIATKYEWYVVSDKDADYALQKYCRMTLAEFRAEVEAETEETVETTEQVAEVNTVETEAQEVSKNFDADIRYEFNGGAGMDTSPNFATATEAAQWIIDFAANHPEYTFTGGRVHDNGNCKRYPFTDADITALNANKAAQEVSTEKVDIKEIIAEGLKQVDFSNVTKFEVGKTYFGATWEGEFNPNGAVIVKKLTVTKITPKTICTVDENGCTRRSKFTEAYAGTTEGFTIGTPNGYVDIYAFNEYTPAVAAVPTDNYTVWSEAIMAIREGKIAEVNMVEEKNEVSEYKPQTSWENPHTYETEGNLDTDRYLAARNHFTTVEELLPELGELKAEIDTVNDKFLRVSFAIDTCKHFFLNKACDPFFLFRHEYNKEADTIIKASVRLYDKCIAIDFDKTFEHLSTFQYIDHGIRNETYHKAWEIFEAIRDNLGDQALASELSKLADEFGIDRALLLQSSDCRFNPALFAEKSAEPAPEPTETNSLKKLYAEVNSKLYTAMSCPTALQKHVNTDALYSLRETLEEAMDSAKPAPPETSAAVVPAEINLTDKYQAALEGVYVEDEVGDFVPAAGMTNVATDNLMVYRKNGGLMEEDPDKYVELLDMEEELEDVMMDEKIAEENRKLDEAFAETKLGAPELTHGMKLAAQIVASIGNSPLELVNFGYGEYGAPRYVYETADYKFSVTEAMTDCSPDRRLEYVEVFDHATMTKTVYDFKPVLSDELKKFRIECDADFAKLGKSTEPPAESFTTKRDRLISERAFANVTFAEAEKNFKAAKLAKYNADDKLYTFMVSAVEELNEKLLPLPDAEIEVKTMEGYLAFIYPESVYADFTDMKFTLRGDCSELNGVTLGTYDTPEQVMTAVEQFKAAIERGDKRFDFANLDKNFDKHSLRDSLKRAMKIALERHEGFVKLGQMTAAENEMKLYAICHDALATLK